MSLLPGRYKLINNTGLSKDTMLYNEETADRVVPGGMPVRNIHAICEAGEPVKILIEVDFLEFDLGGARLGVRMRIPGTQEIADVAEIRYKDGRVFRLP